MYPGSFAATTTGQARGDHGRHRPGGDLPRARRRGQPPGPAVLARWACEPGDHVAFCIENQAHFHAVAWGAHYAGLFYTAISTRLTAEETAYIVNDCGARVFITSAAHGRAGRRAGRPLTPGVELRLLVPSARCDRRIGAGYDDYLGRAGPAGPIRWSTRWPARTCSTARAPPVDPKGVKSAPPSDPLDTPTAGQRPVHAAVRPDRGHRVPLPGPALPLRSAALQHGRPPVGRHGGGHGALRPRARPWPSSSGTG